MVFKPTHVFRVFTRTLDIGIAAHFLPCVRTLVRAERVILTPCPQILGLPYVTDRPPLSTLKPFAHIYLYWILQQDL